MNEQARARYAGLAGASCKDGRGTRTHRGEVEVRIRKDDIRGFSAEFEGELCEAGSRAFGDAPTGLRRSCKRDFSYFGMSNKRIPGHLTEARDDVDYTRRKAGRVEELSDRED